MIPALLLIPAVMLIIWAFVGKQSTGWVLLWVGLAVALVIAATVIGLLAYGVTDTCEARCGVPVGLGTAEHPDSPAITRGVRR